MADNIFGVPYANIQNVNLPATGFQIDIGSFADDGGTPPQFFRATIGGGTVALAGPYANITSVLATTS